MIIDHDTFNTLELDGLYDELDEPSARALASHAASCETCGPHFERLRRARLRGRAALAEHVSNGFESRVMAAVDAALSARHSRPNVLGALPSRAPNENVPATVVRLFSRPWLAAAASMLLVLGAAALLGQKAMSRSPSGPATSLADNAPAGDTPYASVATATASAAPAAPAGSLAAGAGDDSRPGEAPPNDVKDVGGALALNDAPAPAKPRPAARAATPPMAEPLGRAAKAGGNDITFAAAKQLYAAGRYREAQAKFEVLASANPEAGLYAARCVQRTSGCSAAVARFDQIAFVYAGTSLGSRAAAEANGCYAALGGRPGGAAASGAGAGPANVRASPKAAAPASPAASATESDVP